MQLNRKVTTLKNDNFPWNNKKKVNKNFSNSAI